MKKLYYTADREAGNIIEWFDTLEEAREAIKEYEKQDQEEGSYTKDFYSILDNEKMLIE